jgi:hypothetical protein
MVSFLSVALRTFEEAWIAHWRFLAISLRVIRLSQERMVLENNKRYSGFMKIFFFLSSLEKRYIICNCALRAAF